MKRRGIWDGITGALAGLTLLLCAANVHAQALWAPKSGTATSTSAEVDCTFPLKQLWIKNDSTSVTLYVNAGGSTATTSSFPVAPLEHINFWPNGNSSFSVITASGTAAYRAQCSNSTNKIESFAPQILSSAAVLTSGDLDVGSSGTAGTIDIFPSTASKGKFTLSVTDQTGNTTVTLNPDAMGQATTVHIADPGAAASYMMQSTAAITLAEADVLDAVTAGTVSASKALVVDSNKDLGDLRNLDAVNADLGASGTAGTVDIFPTTAASGKIQIAAADSAGDTTTTITNASQAGARTYTIPDAGASASFVMGAGAATIAGAKTFSSPILATAGTQGNFTAFALTSGAAAAAFAKVTVPSGSTAGGTVEYCAEATDLTDYQARCGIIPWSAVNKAGTITCTVGTVTTATDVVAVSAGTLAATTSCADATSNVLDLKVTATTSLTVGGGYLRWRYRVNGLAPATLTVAAQ